MRKRLAIFAAACCLCLRATAGDSANFILPSGVEITIVERSFTTGSFRLEGCTDESAMCLINGRVAFGVIGHAPSTYVESIQAKFGGKTHVLDSGDMFDAWGDRPLEVPGAIRYFGGQCLDSDNCRLRGLFSDAGGLFVAEWQIVNGVSVRTAITGSSDIVNLFREHIDPPLPE